MSNPIVRSRLSIDVTVRDKEMINSAVIDTNENTIASLIRRSVRLYTFLFKVQSNGGKIILYDKDGKPETLRIL